MAYWVNATAAHTRDDLQASSSYLRALAQHLDGIAKLDDMLVLREEIDGTNRVIVPTSLIGEVIEEAHQGFGTAHDGVKNMLERLVHSYYWPGMKRDVQLQLSTCPTCDKFHSHSKRQRAKLNPIPRNDRGDILAIDDFGGKASLPETPRSNRYVLTMIDLFTKFGVDPHMPDLSARTVADALLSRWVLLGAAPRRMLTDQGTNFESAVVQNLWTIWRIDKVRTTAYHPAGNGACDRLNQTIKRGLQKMLNEKRMEEWDVVLMKSCSPTTGAYIVQEASLPISLRSVGRRAYPARFLLAYPRWSVRQLPAPLSDTRDLA